MLVHHLSRNSLLYNYNEMVEEVLIMLLKNLYVHYREENDNACLKVVSKKLVDMIE